MTANLAISTSAVATAIVGRTALERAVSIAANVVEKRSTYPILSNLRLQGDGSTLFITGTDSDIELVVAVPAPADCGFDTTISAHALNAILKGAPSAEFVAFTKEPGIETVTVDFEVAQYELATLTPEAWPTMRGPGDHSEDDTAPAGNFDGVYRFTMPGKALYDAFDSVRFAISNEETRYYLNGIYLAVIGDKLRTVASDGHRLARQEINVPMGADGMPGVIVPKGTIALLEKLIRGKKCPESVAVSLTETKIRFQFDDVTITSKLVEGTFPDTDRVTPRHNDKTATFPIAAMVKKIAAVSAIASDRGGKAVKVSFSNDTCELSVINPDMGTAKAQFPVERDFDGEFEIGFNAKYLTDILAELAAGGDNATMHFNDASGPTLITGGKEGFLTVLMPMRV